MLKHRFRVLTFAVIRPCQSCLDQRSPSSDSMPLASSRSLQTLPDSALRFRSALGGRELGVRRDHLGCPLLKAYSVVIPTQSDCFNREGDDDLSL